MHLVIGTTTMRGPYVWKPCVVFIQSHCPPQETLTQCFSNWVSRTPGVMRNVDKSLSILYVVIISSSLLV